MKKLVAGLMGTAAIAAAVSLAPPAIAELDPHIPQPPIW